MEKGEKYLPVGTVVMLAGGTKRAMITGFCSTGDEVDKTYDYSGCIYPEGFLSSNQVCLFDHDQIVEVFHTGLIDDEEKNFKTQLVAIVAAMGDEPTPESAPASAAPISDSPPPVIESIPAIDEMPAPPPEVAPTINQMPAPEVAPETPEVAPIPEQGASIDVPDLIPIDLPSPGSAFPTE